MRAQLLGVLGDATGIYLLDGLDEPRMERAAALEEQVAVRDLVRERMLEGALGLREEAGFVEELRRLEPPQARAQGGLIQLGDRLQDRQRHVLADHGGHL